MLKLDTIEKKKLDTIEKKKKALLTVASFWMYSSGAPRLARPIS